MAENERGDNEVFYDEEIAPALIDLAKRCNERGMAFVASVEYDQDKRGDTYFMTEDAGIAINMVYLAARAAPNVDGFVINLKRHCNKHGIDTESSFILKD
jgi:hypothetical protein